MPDTPARPLTELQQSALVTAAYYVMTATAVKAMPGLAKRGLAEPAVVDGVKRWKLTPAGIGEAVRIHDARRHARDVATRQRQQAGR